jgi:eukaryotic-like serine/threonine-protein kinase
MELVEGPTLEELIVGARGLQLDDALAIARQMAEALEAAHEKGIVHRDLKPANVKVTPDGQVKVLDFGLAKALAPDGAGASAEAMNSPTLTARATEAGLILGTAAYMAPEQARGKAVDKRADIWAFGAVLFEMLTGRRAFAGETVSDTLAAVLKTDPDWSKLPPDTAPFVRRLLARCLTRNPAERLRDIGEARIALEHGNARLESPGAAVAAGDALGPRPPAWRRALPWALAALFLVTTLAAWFLARPSSTATSYELAIAPPADSEFEIGSNSGNVTVSPDGTHVAFVASTSGSAAPALWVRSLSTDDARPLPGTAGVSYPFWSPDSRKLGFFAHGKLKTLDIAGGLPNVIADAPNGRGGSWCDDGTMLFTPQGGGSISKVPAQGGQAVGLTKLDASRGEDAHYWPVCLPGSQKFLYFVRSTQADNGGIYLWRVDGTGSPIRLVSALSSGLYAPPANGEPGELIWARDTDLFAQPLDVDAGTLRGDARKIASGVRVEESQRQLMAGVSTSGVLVWATARAALSRFAIYDRTGHRLGTLPIDPGKLLQAAFSPDGTRLLFTRPENGTADIWLHDFATGSTRRVTTSPDYDEQGAWSPDGRSVAYSSGGDRLVVTRLDGSSPPLVVAGTYLGGGQVWAPSGRTLLVTQQHSGTGQDLAALSLDQPKQIVQLSADPGDEWPAAFSPDGRWLAIVSNRTGREEVYIVRYDDSGRQPRLGSQRIPVSGNGGVALMWRRDGRELLFLSPDGQIMSAPVTLGADSVTVGQPRPLFALTETPADGNYVAAAPDGSRFVVAEFPYAAAQAIRVKTDWRK